ncbi:MAG: redoxin domain-containing protein [Calditrichaeota bacterium]|nr:redoxin domain-containing protein [Calditrichota bacterium]
MRTQKMWLVVLVLVTIVGSCGKAPNVTVSLKPEKPIAGEKITVQFKPRRLVSKNKKDQKIIMIAQLNGGDSEKNIIVPMDLKGDIWQAELQTDTAHCLLSVKFEDARGRVEDNNQWGWNFVLYDKDKRTPKKNGYFRKGKIYLGEGHAGARPDFERAKQVLGKELSLYPENYRALFALWQSELATAINAEQKKKEIIRKLDSLKRSVKNNFSVSLLEFDTAFRLLNDLPRALVAGKEMINSQNHSKEAERARYTLAFLLGNGKRDAILSNLENFAKNTPYDEYRKIALRRLGDEYQRGQHTNRAIQFYRQYLEIAPDDIPVLLTLATLSLKSGKIDESQALIEKAKKENNAAHYLQSNPWMRPTERTGEMAFNLCHILSTQADVFYKKGDFGGAIRSRRESIDKGSLFPAFEWEKIGDTYRQMGAKDSAFTAYCRAIAINKNQQSAMNKAQRLFLGDGGNRKNFTDYLQQKVQEQLKSMSRQAPDCLLKELGGNSVKISDFKGKVVLVSFWDIWSDASRQEIYQLNQLMKDFPSDSEVEFLGVSIETPVSVQRYVKENPFHFRLFHSGYDAKQAFGVIGFPSHFLIDRFGKIRYQHIGYTRDLRTMLKSEINSLLSEKQNIS